MLRRKKNTTPEGDSGDKGVWSIHNYQKVSLESVFFRLILKVVVLAMVFMVTSGKEHHSWGNFTRRNFSVEESLVGGMKNSRLFCSTAWPSCLLAMFLIQALLNDFVSSWIMYL